MVLAETLGSTASYLCIDTSRFYCVGLEINANHLRAARSGVVTGTARALHVGRTTQVWDAEIRSESTGKTIALFRCTDRKSVV